MARVLRGDVWLVRLDPTEGHEIKKTRPALIVQNDIGNAYSPTTIVAPITSTGLTIAHPAEAVIASSASGLAKRSKVLLTHLRAIDKQRLVKRLGHITDVEQTFVDDALQISLGLRAA